MVVKILLVNDSRAAASGSQTVERDFDKFANSERVLSARANVNDLTGMKMFFKWKQMATTSVHAEPAPQSARDRGAGPGGTGTMSLAGQWRLSIKWMAAQPCWINVEGARKRSGL